MSLTYTGSGKLFHVVWSSRYQPQVRNNQSIIPVSMVNTTEQLYVDFYSQVLKAVLLILIQRFTELINNIWVDILTLIDVIKGFESII